jgi:ADP-ribose pyrophosphatase
MQPWQVLASRPLVDRQPWLTVWEEDVLLPNGEQITGYVRAQNRDYTMVFALLEDGTVPLVSQYKHGIAGPSYDLPSGYLDEGEDTLLGAQRELREETGAAGGAWRLLGHWVIDTNRSNTSAHCYLATGVRLGGPQELDATEALEVTYHTPVELQALVFNGTINSLASVATIMHALQLLAAGAAA